MTKQEEMREGLEQIMIEGIKRHDNGEIFAPRITTQEIPTYLHSKGCVIKVGDIKSMVIAGKKCDKVDFKNIALAEELV